jgi:hypothetical protein
MGTRSGRHAIAAGLVTALALCLPAAASAFVNPLFTWGGTADPGMFTGGGRYYAATTSGVDGSGAMPIRSSADRVNWSDTGRVFRPGGIPSWVDASGGFWAPQIYLFHSINRYVAYYAAINKSTGKRCIGRATSTTLDAFTDLGRPYVCQSTGAYSVIDPSIFYDPRTAKHYLLYKDDLAASQGAKRIVIREIGPDGYSGLGGGYQILSPSQGWEQSSPGWASVEAPTMVYNGSDGLYYLFYSGNGYSTDKYAVGAARARAPLGYPNPGDDFGKFSGNPVLTGDTDPGFCGVGGQDVTNSGSEGWLIFYHAYTSQSGEGCTGGRYLMMDELHWDASGGWPRVHDGTPST